MNEIPEDDEASIEEAKAHKKEVLAQFIDPLEADLQTAVTWRSPIEQRWIEDLRQKHGEQPSLPEVKENNVVPAGTTRTANDEYRYGLDNMTRPATIQIAARLSDMLFPTNEPNWSLEPSPLPDLSNPEEVMVDEVGQPFMVEGPPDPETGQPTQREMTASDIQARIKKIADEKCARMAQHISDALQECNYNAQGRNAIQDACDIGTGIIEGPVVKRKQRTSYQSFTMEDGSKVPSLTVKQEDKPAGLRRDPWDVFPQPCRHISEAEHAFILHLLTKKKLRELAKQPGFDKEQINELLGVDPELGVLTAGGQLVQRDRILAPNVDTMTGRYAVWKYLGPIPREVLEQMGTEIDPDDHLTTFHGEVWFCQGFVLKAVMSTDEYCEQLPLYFYNYEKDPTCCFGFSVPYTIRSEQYSVNQAWSAVKLNMMMSSAPQIGVIPGKLEPINNRVDLSFTKPKVWGATSDVDDINKVLSVFSVPNFTAPLMEVYQASRRNLMDKTLLPQWVEGEPTKAAQTSSGLAMLMNSANIVQRAGAKGWDDDVTSPFLSAMNRWFLLNSDDEECKGDYDVVPKGESHLLVKDIKVQHLQILTALSDNPRFAPHFDDRELLERNIKILDEPTKGLLRDKQTVEAEQAAAASQPNPDVMRAEASMAGAQASVDRNAVAREQMAHDKEQGDKDRMVKLVSKDAEVEIAAAELASGEVSEQNKLEAQARLHQMDAEIDAAKLGMDARLEAEKIAASERKVDVQVQREKPFRI